jgi:serine O-acetyltransferase
MGVVIGETAEIGDDVSLFQGVTLGGTGKERGKRHPTLGNGVTVGVGAHILGAVQIGDGAKIGGGAVVLRDVPPYTTAVGVPAHATTRLRPNDCADGGNRRVHRIADPAQEQVETLRQQVAALTARLVALESRSSEIPERPKSALAPDHARTPEPVAAFSSDCK